MFGTASGPKTQVESFRFSQLGRQTLEKSHCTDCTDRADDNEAPLLRADESATVRSAFTKTWIFAAACAWTALAMPVRAQPPDPVPRPAEELAAPATLPPASIVEVPPGTPSL